MSDFIKISEIAKRAISNFDKYISNRTISTLDIIMDVEAVHENMPLDLDALLAADEANFNHDIVGIIRYLNRGTGQLEQCFVPRYAK